MFIKNRIKIIVIAVYVDSWKKQSMEHKGALDQRLWFVEQYQHIPPHDPRRENRVGMLA
jgi:hypothetical protein